MSVTAASLKAKHPEFDAVDNSVVTSYIEQAERTHDSAVWGDKYDDGVELLACDLMARMPFCSTLRLVKDDSTTVYQHEWERLRNHSGAAYRMLP